MFQQSMHTGSSHVRADLTFSCKCFIFLHLKIEFDKKFIRKSILQMLAMQYSSMDTKWKLLYTKGLIFTPLWQFSIMKRQQWYGMSLTVLDALQHSSAFGSYSLHFLVKHV